jgi:hypothetical protein
MQNCMAATTPLVRLLPDGKVWALPYMHGMLAIASQLQRVYGVTRVLAF